MLRRWLRYYSSLIAEEYEWIKGLDEYNIDNFELENRFDNMIELIESAHGKIKEYIEDIKK